MPPAWSRPASSSVVNGDMHRRSLRDTLDKVTETVGTTGHDAVIAG
jgi:hypothetical protein